MSFTEKKASGAVVVIAFATVYIVWGSTYFFIQRALTGFSPYMLGALRFLTAGILMSVWCLLRKEQLFNRRQMFNAAITGLLLLFLGTGAVIIAETKLPSSMVGVIITSEVIWLVLFDSSKWKDNFSNRGTIPGLLLGLGGVVLLFIERMLEQGFAGQIWVYLVLVGGTMSWAAGSVFSKSRASGSSSVNASWQMIAAGMAFFLTSIFTGDWQATRWQEIPLNAWLSVLYLIIMGSLAAFSAYVWLLKVRPITQVSTHLYVNPVVAVILGALFADEHMTSLQFLGLFFILFSVLLINLSQYRMPKLFTRPLLK